MSEPTRKEKNSRIRAILAALAGALLLFTIAGFFVAPPIAKSFLLKKASKALGREVSAGKVRINPYTLSASVADLRVRDTDGETLASWKRLFVDFELVSVFGRSWVFREIALEEPYARLVILKDGALNVSDIVERLKAQAPPPPGTPPAEPKGVRIGLLAIEGARFEFRDLSREEPFSTVLGPLRLRLEEFSTEPGSRSPYTFAGSTEAGERFAWAGTFGLSPLRSSGEIAIEGLEIPRYAPYYAETLPFRIRDGKAWLRSEYAFEWGKDQRVLALENAGLRLESLDVTEKGSEESVVTVPKFEIEQAKVDLLTGAAALGPIRTSGATILVRKEADGKIGIAEMLAPLFSGPSTAPFTTGPISVTGATIRLEDRGAPRPVEIALENLNIEAKGYDAAPGAELSFTSSFSWTESGNIRLEGTASSSFDRGELSVSAEEVALRPIAPYVEPYLDLFVTEGKLGAEGTLSFDFAQTPSLLAYEGTLKADGVASIDAAYREDLVRGASFRLAPVKFRLDPLLLEIGEIDATRPFLRWIVNEDGTNNILRVFKTPEPQPAAEPQAAAQPSPAARIAIGAFKIREGRLDFTDRLVKPSVALSIGNLEGSISGLSSDELTRADVSLAGKVDGYAPFGITGTINPLIENEATDLAIRAEGIELTTLGPYSGKYLGYGIRKGKLALDLGYRIENRKLDSRNVVTIDQLELGDKTESEDAIKIPVKLAIALLKDRDGKIVLDVPVEGDLGDPEFKMGRVIWRAVRTVLTKIVTSPFALLANAFGGKEEELSRFDFAPGDTSVRPEDAKRLDPIVHALHERPGLSLDIAGLWDEAADTAALKRSRLDRMVRDAKWAALRSTDPALTSPDAVTVTADEYPDYLQAAYEEKFPPPPPAAPSAPPPPPAPAPLSTEEMALRLRDTIPVTPDDLRLLASERSKSVRDAILATAQVEPDRVFLVEAGKAAEGGEGPRVEFTLK